MTDHPLPAPKRRTTTWRFILDRAKEPSSWRGAVFVISAFTASLSPELSEAIIAAGIAIAGLIGLLVPDSPAE